MARAKYPNRLQEFMNLAELNDPALAEKVGTSRQQIHKLRHGERELTREWATRLAPHLGVDWPELMGWKARESDAENTAVDRDAAARVAANVLAHYGQRLQAIRLALGYRSAAGFAARAGIPAAEYMSWEAEEVRPDLVGLALLKERLAISADWVLFGDFSALSGRLVDRMLELGLRRGAPEPARELRAAVRELADQEASPRRRRTLHDQRSTRPFTTIRPPPEN